MSNRATLEQAGKILQIIKESGVNEEEVQNLLPLFSTLLHTPSPKRVKKTDLQKALGVLLPETLEIEIPEGNIEIDEYYKKHWSKMKSGKIPRGKVTLGCCPLSGASLRSLREEDCRRIRGIKNPAGFIHAQCLVMVPGYPFGVIPKGWGDYDMLCPGTLMEDDRGNHAFPYLELDLNLHPYILGTVLGRSMDKPLAAIVVLGSE